MEYPIYGRGRVGTLFATVPSLTAPKPDTIYSREIGEKRYELTDHLGNVRATLTDVKLSTVTGGVPDDFAAEITSYHHMYPFGMAQPGRVWEESAVPFYRYGYNGMETDPEHKGEWGDYTTYFRQYDPRLGRWMSQDPIVHAWESPYVAMFDNPILYADPSGAEGGDPLNPGTKLGRKVGGGGLGRFIRSAQGMDRAMRRAKPSPWRTAAATANTAASVGSAVAAASPVRVTTAPLILDDNLGAPAEAAGSGSPETNVFGDIKGALDAEVPIHPFGRLAFKSLQFLGKIVYYTADGVVVVATMTPADFIGPHPRDDYDAVHLDGTPVENDGELVEASVSTALLIAGGPIGRGVGAVMRGVTRLFGRAAAPAAAEAAVPVVAEEVAGGAGTILVREGVEEAVSTAGKTVLGKYPEYMTLAEEIGARRFNVPMEVWKKMSPEAQWEANRVFLDRMIARGDEIILSNPVRDINEVSGGFRAELDYLIEKGFRISEDGTRIIK